MRSDANLYTVLSTFLLQFGSVRNTIVATVNLTHAVFTYTLDHPAAMVSEEDTNFMLLGGGVWAVASRVKVISGTRDFIFVI